MVGMEGTMEEMVVKVVKEVEVEEAAKEAEVEEEEEVAEEEQEEQDIEGGINRINKKIMKKNIDL